MKRLIPPFLVIFVTLLNACYGKSEPIPNTDICKLAIDSVLPKWDEIAPTDTLYTDLSALQNMSYADKETVVKQLHKRTNNPTLLCFKKKVMDRFVYGDSVEVRNGYIVEVSQFERVSPTKVTVRISVFKSSHLRQNYEAILSYQQGWRCESVQKKLTN